VISQTHFSSSRKNSIISSLIGSERALKILARKRARLVDFEGIIQGNLCKYLNIVMNACCNTTSLNKLLQLRR
jgi:hypothetical protein